MKNRSKLAEAIEARERKQHDFEVQDFFGLGNKPIHKVGIRVSTKSEQDSAVIAAHKYVEGKAGSALEDNDIMVDAKTIEVLFYACRQAEPEAEPGAEPPKHNYPAFPGPQWMRDNLTTDQLAVMLNLYNEVRRKESPLAWQIGTQDVVEIAEACVTVSDTDLPEALLAKFDREWVTQAFVMLAVKLKEAQNVIQSFSESVGDEEEAPQAHSEADEPGVSDDGSGGEGSDKGALEPRLHDQDGGSGELDES